MRKVIPFLLLSLILIACTPNAPTATPDLATTTPTKTLEVMKTGITKTITLAPGFLTSSAVAKTMQKTPTSTKGTPLTPTAKTSTPIGKSATSGKSTPSITKTNTRSGFIATKTTSKITATPTQPVINMGTISSATTNGTLKKGEIHSYKFTKQSSSGYEYVAFAVDSSAFSASMTVVVDGGVFSGSPVSSQPTSFRVPSGEGKTIFLCLDRSGTKFSKDFTLYISSKDGKSGAYSISLLLMNSRANSDGCLIVLKP